MFSTLSIAETAGKMLAPQKPFLSQPQK